MKKLLSIILLIISLDVICQDMPPIFENNWSYSAGFSVDDITVKNDGNILIAGHQGNLSYYYGVTLGYVFKEISSDVVINEYYSQDYYTYQDDQDYSGYPSSIIEIDDNTFGMGGTGYRCQINGLCFGNDVFQTYSNFQLVDVYSATDNGCCYAHGSVFNLIKNNQNNIVRFGSWGQGNNDLTHHIYYADNYPNSDFETFHEGSYSYHMWSNNKRDYENSFLDSNDDPILITNSSIGCDFKLHSFSNTYSVSQQVDLFNFKKEELNVSKAFGKNIFYGAGYSSYSSCNSNEDYFPVALIEADNFDYDISEWPPNFHEITLTNQVGHKFNSCIEIDSNKIMLASSSCDFAFFNDEGSLITIIPEFYFGLCDVKKILLGNNDDYIFLHGNSITSINRSYFNLGCTDSLAINYSFSSFIDDNSCMYDVFGCMDIGYIEYNSSVTVDDGSCNIPIVLGCLDSLYVEYDEFANISDSSCNTLLSIAFDELSFDYEILSFNYDSLESEVDFLSSQVSELQQELLVPNIDVDMAIGWNMIGFSCSEEKELTDALNEIVDKVLIMKNNNGSVFMPEFSFNGIGDLTPGHGYQIKVADYILDFNICE